MAGIVLCAVPAAADQSQYIQEDVGITGRAMYVFTDSGEQVTAVLGGFKMELGTRTVCAQEAILWIKEFRFGAATRRDIIIYMRGNARVVEPNGSVTSDRTMLVTLHQQGRLTATGQPGRKLQISDQSLANDPLYQEALAVRQKSTVRRPGATSEPVVVTTQPAATQVASLPIPLPTTHPATGPAKPKLPPSVSFSFEKLTAQELEPGGNKTAIIARGAYLTQGTAKSALFLELRAQNVVVFTEPIQEKKAGTPYTPRLVGLPSGTGGAGGTGIAGVYLEGDVIIARGDRTMQAKAAYYDFVCDRAYVVEPVLRMVQEQRNIPIYVRADEARILSATQTQFKNARLTTSDFYTPEYHIGASEILFTDTTVYDEQGQQVSQRSYQAELKDATFNVGQVPLLWWPYEKADLTQETTPLRRINFGKMANLGVGVQTEWDLFRLLGMLTPQGVRSDLDLEAYQEGVVIGVNTKYARREGDRQYSGYSKFYGVYDALGHDDLAHDLKDVPAPNDRGWALMRHKELLPKDVELQFELSYASDKNFLQAFFPNEFYTGKEQETLLYAKKQRDNWAVTSLLEYRLYRFETQTESFPDLSLYLIGEPLLCDRLTFFNESHLGFLRYRPASQIPEIPDEPLTSASDPLGRADTRNEVNLPVHLGPINLVPYGVARGTAWSEVIDGGGDARPYGQGGIKANTHIWRVYDDVNNRLLDVNKLKHEMTPQIVAFGSADGGVGPDDLFPLTPGIEQHLGQIQAVSLALYQRLLTKRGPAGNQYSVDWMRLDVIASFFNDKDVPVPPSDGRFFLSRPEYSIPRSNVTGEYTWNISDATSFLADVNYDNKTSVVGRADAGFAVSRDPRLRYYFGWRYIRDLNASVGTFGANYEINRKYSISVFEQYDFDFGGGTNLASSISLIRKFPRWYGAFTFSFDQRTNEVSAFVTFWPEGIPEIRLSSQRVTLLSESSNN